MTTTQPPQRPEPTTLNPVTRAGVLKEQVCSEEHASKTYDDKWKFLQDFPEICIKEAEKQGFTKEEYIKAVKKKKPKKEIKLLIPKPLPSGPIPTTSSGMIGWRSSRSECQLEVFGRFQAYKKPPLDEPGRPPTPPYKYLILG